VNLILARNYTRHPGPREIDVFVIHDMEAPEKGTTAEAVAAYFARPVGAPQASAHYCIDNNSAVQSVRDNDIAWAAPCANHNGLHFEHAGYANQSMKDWLDPYGNAMLEVSAHHVAAKCKQYGIPVRFLTAADLRAGKKGLTGHAQVTAAFPGTGSHTDPGPNFPWRYYLARVNAYRYPKPVAKVVTAIQYAVKRRTFRNSGIRTEMTYVEPKGTK
jgi:N-acetyl-anhydromuramyl-L-alanine amidase AmpD